MRIRIKNRCLPLLSLALLSGCSWFRHDDEPAKLTAADFYTPATAPATPPPIGPLAEKPSEQPGSTTAPAAAEPAPATDAAAPVAPARTAVPVGTYMTIGGVLAQVNGVPIYASAVMREVEPSLRVDAKRLSAEEFRYLADKRVQSQINEFKADEIQYAAAQENLGQDDKKLADALTTDYRQKMIIAAGGSLQEARRQAVERGENFEDLVKKTNRTYMIELFREKKIYPRVQITTADMRRFYRENVKQLFTEPTNVTVLLIRIDPVRSGGKAAALDKIRALRERVTTGKEDFGAIAGTINDDGELRGTKGLRTIAPGEMAQTQLEAALFAGSVGTVIEIVDDLGGFYIAKILSKKDGRVMPFEDQRVQATIRNEIQRVQVINLSSQFYAELEHKEVFVQDDRMKQTALEMIAQYYPIWHAQP